MNERNESRIPTLSQKEQVVLDLLISGGEQFGLELVENSRGAVGRGTVYVTLGRMERKGLVSSRPEDRPDNAVGWPRRLYLPTGYGRRVFQAWDLARAQLAPLGALP